MYIVTQSMLLLSPCCCCCVVIVTVHYTPRHNNVPFNITISNNFFLPMVPLLSLSHLSSSNFFFFFGFLTPSISSNGTHHNHNNNLFTYNDLPSHSIPPPFYMTTTRSSTFKIIHTVSVANLIALVVTNNGWITSISYISEIRPFLTSIPAPTTPSA